MTGSNARIGRPSKGDRRVMVTRPAAALAEIVMREAQARDQSYSEYIATILAEYHDRPDLAPSKPAPKTQEAFPLTG